MFRDLLCTLMYLQCATGDSGTNEIPGNSTSLAYYWNVPTFQCDSHKINFTELADKYGILQNEDDRFQGDQIAILYDPGDFPAILKDGAGKSVLRNGGVPQAGNLTLHLALFDELVEQLIPDGDFSGLAVIDFESWRPIFRQNFGTLAPYKELSFDLERKMHPFWPDFLVEKEAERTFEFHARRFMEETIFVGKQMRPNATWGYYAYPYCFNMSPSNMQMACPDYVIQENNRLNWLFAQTNNLHPSLYLSGVRLTAKEKIELIEGRINEAHRIAAYVKTRTNKPKIVPYFWYKYHDNKNFVSKEDLHNSFLLLATSKIDGLIIWGSSNDVNTREKCLALYQYVDTVLGPSLINNFA